MRTSEKITETVIAVIVPFCISFVICFFLYGVFLLIASPTTDEKMADKGYARIVVNDGVSRVGQWIWAPTNSTEYRLYLKSLVEK